MKVLPYSYSSLTGFESCAFKHYKVKVSKEVKDKPYQAAVDGIDVHKQAEDYINGAVQTLEGPYAPKIIAVVDQHRKNTGTLHAEKQLAVTRTMEPCGWWDAECHARGVLDVYQVNGDTAISEDWKTGKVKNDIEQLKHSALMIFMHEPKVQKVNFAYHWLKAHVTTRGTVYRDFMKQDWDKWERRVIKLEQALVENKWPKTQNGLCKNYCPVTECEHNGQFGKTF